MKLKPLHEQVVAVFGASSGIGRETALRFARAGAKLVIAARGEPALQTVADAIRRENAEVTPIVADAIHFDQVRKVADAAVEAYGRLDTWVHVAAVSIYATFEQTTPEEFRHIVETNLVGQAYGAKAALPYLKRQGSGALIHVSSVEARCALPFQSAYAASKHGIKGFLQALRLELAEEDVGISVTEVMPSSINTPFFNKARTRLGVKPRPAPPVYEPALVADAILYAAAHPIPEITVGGAGFALTLAERVSPRLAGAIVSSMAFSGQRTEEPKLDTAPDNLYQPLEEFHSVEGDFSGESRRTSSYTWLATHPAIATLLAGSLLTAAFMTTRKSRNLSAQGGRL